MGAAYLVQGDAGPRDGRATLENHRQQRAMDRESEVGGGVPGDRGKRQSTCEKMGTKSDEFIRHLSREHRVVVIGGLAVIAHGLSRGTMDANVWLEPLDLMQSKLAKGREIPE